MSRVVLYMRVSSKDQLDGYSLDAQRVAGIRYIADHGRELVKEYTDEAETARTARREDFQLMLRELEDLHIDYLVVHKSDRFARNKLDHFMTKEILKKHGVKLISITENFEDSPQGRLVEGVMASLNEYYSDNLAQEVKKGQVQKISDGGWPAQAPIGYRNVRRDGKRKAEAIIEPDPVQAQRSRPASAGKVTAQPRGQRHLMRSATPASGPCERRASAPVAGAPAR